MPFPIARSPDKFALLRDVSRSFYLSIRLLPMALRQPMAVAYLLARATDTIADTAQLPGPDRLARLHALARAINGEGDSPGAVAALAASFAPLQTDEHERRLIQALPQCLAWLAALPEVDRADIRGVLDKITLGQALDIERFGDGGPVRALASADDLDVYTYLVAGCVGEFWTQLCCRHLPDFATLPSASLLELGRSYGMGLQLINILRDTRADFAAGRCYLPADELAAAGLSPAHLLDHPQRLAAVQKKWLAQAGQNLALGMRYACSVNSRRVRAASALPALIGARTLALLQAPGPEAAGQRVKVPRREMRSILGRVVFTLAGRQALDTLFRDLGSPA